MQCPGCRLPHRPSQLATPQAASDTLVTAAAVALSMLTTSDAAATFEACCRTVGMMAAMGAAARTGAALLRQSSEATLLATDGQATPGSTTWGQRGRSSGAMGRDGGWAGRGRPMPTAQSSGH